MAGSDTDYEYESGAPGLSDMKKLRTETMIKKCLTTYYSRQDFKPNETQSTDNESRRGSLLQVMIGDVVIEHVNNQKEVDDKNSSIDHRQKQKQIIGVGLNEAPKLSADRGQEPRAQISLLKQQNKEKLEQDAIVEIATKDIRSAGQPKYNQVPGPSESLRTIEQRAKSAEATRRWRERKRDICNSSIKQAKTAAERMREYRKRKKMLNEAPKVSADRVQESRAQKSVLKQQSKQKLEPDAIVEIATKNIRSAGPSNQIKSKYLYFVGNNTPPDLKSGNTLLCFIRSTKDNQVPEPSKIRTIEQRTKSAEATRRWRERKRELCNSSNNQAKTTAERMREYRKRKKLTKTILLMQQSEQDFDVNKMIVSTTSPQVNQSACPLTIKSTSPCYSCNPYCNRLWFTNDLEKASDDCEDLLKKVSKPLESGASHSDRESTTTSPFHTVCDIPVEEYVIKTENESDNNEGSDPGEEESAEPNLQLSLVTVQGETDGSRGDFEDPPVAVEDKIRKDNSISATNVSTETAKDLVEMLRALKQNDSYDAFGRYVAAVLRSMPAQTARDLQPCIMKLLADGGEVH